MRLLVVEDSAKMASVLRRGLRREGHAVDVVAAGEDALRMSAVVDYDAVVLDLMLPGIDGFETCRRLRAAGSATPVLMLTARDAVEDRVAGLDGGADDYLVKPFSLAELGARLRALCRRGPITTAPVLEAGDLRLDLGARLAWRGHVAVPLTRTEFALLETLMRHPGQVLSRGQLAEHVWDGRFEHRSNVIEVYVGYVRGKIDRPFGRRAIETVRGFGYVLRADGG
jgi:two-component system OmpR family response regulator